jgi:hypothetical protein
MKRLIVFLGEWMFYFVEIFEPVFDRLELSLVSFVELFLNLQDVLFKLN